jgi:phosphohistidine phosphatase
MNFLYLVRHAKSSWAEPGLADIDRPLNKRGKRDAPEMGRRLKERDAVPARIVTSSAKRARGTTRDFVKALGFGGEMEVVASIYGGGAAEVVRVVQSTDDEVVSLMVVGHNPDMADLVNSLTDFGVDNVPTCAVFCSEHDTWADVGVRPGRFRFYDYPKLR